MHCVVGMHRLSLAVLNTAAASLSTVTLQGVLARFSTFYFANFQCLNARIGFRVTDIECFPVATISNDDDGEAVNDNEKYEFAFTTLFSDHCKSFRM